MNLGTQRLRGGDACPWPERRGRVARLVQPNAAEARRYPFHGKAKNEVVVWIEDDPLTRHPRGWSCVIDAGHLEVDA